MIRLIGNIITVLVLLSAMPALAQPKLTVTVDRTEITEIDLLTLTIRFDNPDTTPSLDFNLLERDFDIISRSGPNQNSRISIINGHQSSEIYISWEFRLRPKRLGNLTIPPFHIGKALSQAIPIRVIQPPAAMQRRQSQLVFFDTVIDKQEVFIQEQIIFTIKLYYLGNISGEFPAISDIPDTIIETLENERRYDAISNGRRYYVLEKRYALYPQKSGQLIIPEQIFSGFHAGSGFFSRREPILVKSEQHLIKVKPKPATFPGDEWLPAETLVIEETWNQQPPKFVVGEPANRTLTISAIGLPASLLPSLAKLKIRGAKIYQDPAVEEQQIITSGIKSTQTNIIGIIPTAPGTLVIPELRIPWWNTKTQQLELAISPAQSYTVTGTIPNSRLPQEVSAESMTVSPTTQVTETPAQSFWRYISFTFVGLWLVTLLLWWLHAKPRWSRHVKPKAKLASANHHHTLTKLLKACKQHDAAAAEQLLCRWGIQQYPQIHSIQQFAQLVSQAEFSEEVTSLQALLYGPNPKPDWCGSKLAKCLFKIANHKPKKNRKQYLPDLMNPIKGQPS